jgi:hypothetical protein
VSSSAFDLLATIRRDLAPGDHDNRLIPLVSQGQLPRSVLAALAAEQREIITSDWRSFLVLAARSTQPAARQFFTGLAQGEALALDKLAPFAAATAQDGLTGGGYQPQAGCQAYPAYLAWLALNGVPSDVVLAIIANFTAWGSYCATLAQALRRHYGFDDQACGFFDFFATPAPDMEQQALAVIPAELDTGWQTSTARRYGRLLQAYELMFWNTLADQGS